MSNQSTNVINDCNARLSRVQSQMRHLWWPGRRGQLVEECYNIGYVALENGATEVAEKSLRAAMLVLDRVRPSRTMASLSVFKLLASSHSQLGIHHLDRRRYVEAAAALDAAIALREELRRLFPKDRENEVLLGGALCNRGHACADTNPDMAKVFYQRSLLTIQQPLQPCQCSYWDETRQTWWCEQLEALGDILDQQWVRLAPQFIDNAQAGMASLETKRDNRS